MQALLIDFSLSSFIDLVQEELVCKWWTLGYSNNSILNIPSNRYLLIGLLWFGRASRMLVHGSEMPSLALDASGRNSQRIFWLEIDNWRHKTKFINFLYWSQPVPCPRTEFNPQACFRGYIILPRWLGTRPDPLWWP